MCVLVFSGVQVVPHDRTDTPTPPAVDLSMSPSSRHTPSSPEMTNGNYIPSGVSMTELKRAHTPPLQVFYFYQPLVCSPVLLLFPLVFSYFFFAHL